MNVTIRSSNANVKIAANTDFKIDLILRLFVKSNCFMSR